MSSAIARMTPSSLRPKAVAWAIAVAAASGCGGASTPPAADATGEHLGPGAPTGSGPGGSTPPAATRATGDGPLVDEGAATATLRRWLPAVPPFVPYTAPARSSAVAACGHAPTPREASLCLLKTRDAAALADFLPLARSTRRRHGDSPMEGAAWTDDAGAVDNAGSLGAMTSTRELEAMAVDPAPETRAFGLAALTSVLRAMEERRGVAPTEAQHRAAEQAIGRVCEQHLGEDDPDILHQALNCLYRAHHRSSGAAVAALAAYHRDAAVRASAAVAFTIVSTRSPGAEGMVRLDPRVARAMLERLRAPMARSASLDEVHAREWLCHDLRMALPRHTPGLGEAAEAAARMIDAHLAGSGRSRGCRELATRELTPDPPREPLPRGADGDDGHCEIA